MPTERQAGAGAVVADAHSFLFLTLKLLLFRDLQRLYLHAPNPHGIGLETAWWSPFSYIQHARVSKRQQGPS